MIPAPPPTNAPDENPGPPPRDELDGLLRQWHDLHAPGAEAARDRLLAALARERKASRSGAFARPVLHAIRRVIVNRYSPAAAAALLLTVLVVTFLIPQTTPTSYAQGNVVLCPEGGRLDALGPGGEVLGPCELTRTDVDVRISGFLTRVTLRQQYRNPHPHTIEAVYTFPMSHRAAVDRMTMRVGDRVILGRVKERQQARRIYEATRAEGRVAGLLEQERPNIFTQSVANIEPGASIDIEISYVEMLEASEGAYTFSFPTVVGPRYIPGSPSDSETTPLPEGLTPRRGLVLLAPATVAITHTPEEGIPTSLTPARLANLLSAARPCERPEEGPGEGRRINRPWHHFAVLYPDGSSEQGLLDVSGLGHVNGRWFWIDPLRAVERNPDKGHGFSGNTDQIPDAGRITPMPVRPPTRAGHDIGITVTIDTGGPAIAGLAAPSHEVVTLTDRRAPSRATVTLKNEREIPNRDFVLTWTLAGEVVQESIFTHTGERGNFVSLILQPPARVQPELAVPRELIFVLDTSGSMSGYPIEKAKDVIALAIESMRERDTFNIITFSGDTHILWDAPRPNTAANRGEAQSFLASRSGAGGTEMMRAIETALKQTDRGDGEACRPLRLCIFLTDGLVGNDMAIIDAVRRHRGTTRVFSLGIGPSVNRFLLDGMAKAGGGEVEYVQLESSADEAVARLTRRISTPVLTDIRVEFAGGLEVSEVLPGDGGELPDLFDLKPLVIHGRYTAAGSGKVVITGTTGAGPYRRELDIALPAHNPEHGVIATLWAREKVGSIVSRDLAAAQRNAFPDNLRREVVALGERFNILTQYTSFVAVDHLRITIGGKPRLVAIPVELPAGTRWEGFFGGVGGVRDNLRFGRGVELFGDIPLVGGVSPFAPAAPGVHQFGAADGEGMFDARWIEAPQIDLSMLVNFAHQEPVESQGLTGTVEQGWMEKEQAWWQAESRHHVASQANRAERQQQIATRMERIRGLQRELRYEEAAQVANEVLFLDPLNEHAKLLHDSLTDITTYRRYFETPRPKYHATDWPAKDPDAVLSEGLFPGHMQRRLAASSSRDDLGDAAGTLAFGHPTLPPRELLVFEITRLAAAGRHDEARAHAAQFLRHHPDSVTILALHAAASDTSLSEDDRAALFDELHDSAKAEFDSFLRVQRLARVLHRTLFSLAGLPDAAPHPRAHDAVESPAAPTLIDGGVLVSVLLTGTEQAATDALKAAGAKVLHLSPSAKVAVAVVPIDRLAEIALLDAVRRVEPTSFLD